MRPLGDFLEKSGGRGSELREMEQESAPHRPAGVVEQTQQRFFLGGTEG